MRAATFSGLAAGALGLALVPAARAHEEEKYEVKAGKIEMTNSMNKGQTSTIYFDDFGAKRATQTKMHAVMFGTTVDSEEWDIRPGDNTQIRYKPKEKSATRAQLPPPRQAKPLTGKKAEQAEKIAKQANVSEKALPAKTIAGKECAGKETNAFGVTLRVWSWKGIPFWKESYLEGLDKPATSVEQVTAFEEKAPPESVFKVPDDVKIKEQPAMR